MPDDDARHENAQAEPELYEDKHAILHDFCMQLPYSWLLIAAGGVLWFNDTPKSASVLMVIAGLLCYQCARTSLRQWKLGLKSTFSTWCCALLSAYQAWVWGALRLDGGHACSFPPSHACQHCWGLDRLQHVSPCLLVVQRQVGHGCLLGCVHDAVSTTSRPCCTVAACNLSY